VRRRRSRTPHAEHPVSTSTPAAKCRWVLNARRCPSPPSSPAPVRGAWSAERAACRSSLLLLLLLLPAAGSCWQLAAGCWVLGRGGHKRKAVGFQLPAGGRGRWSVAVGGRWSRSDTAVAAGGRWAVGRPGTWSGGAAGAGAGRGARRGLSSAVLRSAITSHLRRRL
jgi:hypothetical protein